MFYKVLIVICKKKISEVSRKFFPRYIKNGAANLPPELIKANLAPEI
jgi:hypothetical protein